VYSRYRLVHPWVPEMVLNVQSKFFPLRLSVNPLCWFESTGISRFRIQKFGTNRRIRNLATVITSLASAIPVVGDSIVTWLWGGFSVDNATLNRFFSLHYLLPFLIAAVSLLHIAALHQYGSNNPLGINSEVDKINFVPYFYVKDLVGWVVFALFFSIFVFFAPNVLGHPDNYIPANPMSTPAHIVPEWYFRAPMRLFFRGQLIQPSITVFILLCGMCYKTLPRHDFGNGIVLSGDESKLSEGGSHKNCLQVMNSMDKIMNLTYSPTVSPRTSAPLLLTGIVGIGGLPENETHPNAVFLGDAHQAKLNYNWLQDPNLFYSGRKGTFGIARRPKGTGEASPRSRPEPLYDKGRRGRLIAAKKTLSLSQPGARSCQTCCTTKTTPSDAVN